MKMKFLCIAVVLCSIACFAQTNQSAVTFGIGPAGMKSFAGTDAFANYAVTKNFQLRYDNYQVPALNTSGNLAGAWYVLPTCNLLANTNLNCNIISAYARASAGIWRVSTSSTTQDSFGVCGGGGINYSPADNGVMSINLIDIQECKTPQGVVPVYALQLNLALGVNSQNPSAIKKAKAREERKLAKLQAQAAKIDAKGK